MKKIITILLAGIFILGYSVDALASENNYYRDSVVDIGYDEFDNMMHISDVSEITYINGEYYGILQEIDDYYFVKIESNFEINKLFKFNFYDDSFYIVSQVIDNNAISLIMDYDGEIYIESFSFEGNLINRIPIEIDNLENLYLDSFVWDGDNCYLSVIEDMSSYLHLDIYNVSYEGAIKIVDDIGYDYNTLGIDTKLLKDGLLITPIGSDSAPIVIGFDGTITKSVDTVDKAKAIYVKNISDSKIVIATENGAYVLDETTLELTKLRNNFVVNSAYQLPDGNFLFVGFNTLTEDLAYYVCDTNFNEITYNEFYGQYFEIDKYNVSFYFNDTGNIYMVSEYTAFGVNLLSVNSQEVQDSNLDIIVESANTLELSLSTNSIDFKEFNGTKDFEENLDVNITSSLNYDLNVMLNDDLKDTLDETNIINKSNFKIKSEAIDEFKSFNNLKENVLILENSPRGKDLSHRITLKLLGDSSTKKGNYKTNLTFEAIQR